MSISFFERRKPLSHDQQTKIKARPTEISKRLRKCPYPIVPPDIDGIYSELRALEDQVNGRGPATLLDRCSKLLRRAKVVMWRDEARLVAYLREAEKSP